MSPALLFFFRITFDIQDFLWWFHTKLGMVSSISVKKLLQNFDTDCVESTDCFGQDGHFTVNSSNPRTWDIFTLMCVFSLFQQCLIVLSCAGLSLSYLNFFLKYFTVSDSIVNRIAFLISVSDSFVFCA